MLAARGEEGGDTGGGEGTGEDGELGEATGGTGDDGAVGEGIGGEGVEGYLIRSASISSESLSDELSTVGR